jgi:8-oxo-dGTP pyrophosphatase MutT (NUDIX family)
LPGGKFIPNDLELKHTALRESQEEIGINPSQIQLIQGLSPLYIQVSNFLVKTFIGFSPTSLSFIPEPREVDKILEVPLSEILNQFSENKKKLEQNILPEFNFNEFKIWGATALILHEFVELISN